MKEAKIKKDQNKPEQKDQAWCPYCEDETAGSQAICQPCKVTLFICSNCGKSVPRTKKTCPNCGAPMKPS